MTKFAWAILLAAVALLIASVAIDTRWAAGGGAVLLFVAIVYAWKSNRDAGDASRRRADRAAARLREET